MTIAVDLGRKATKQTNKQTKLIISLYHPYNGGKLHCTFHVIAVSCSSSSSSSSSSSVVVVVVVVVVAAVKVVIVVKY